LEPASHYPEDLKQSGYAWKVCALHGGVDKLSAMCLHGQVDDDTIAWIRKHAVTEHIKRTAKKTYTANAATADVEATLLAGDIKKFIELDSKSSATDTADLKNNLYDDKVVENLEAVIAIYKGDEQLGSREETKSEKYSEEDLK